MPRYLITTPFPEIPSEIPDGVLVVTPHGPAAHALRRPKVTLQQLARKVLAARGIYATEPRLASRLLRDAIKEVDPSADAGALARRISSTLQTILRIGIDTEELRRHGSPRAVMLARIADAYKARLRSRGLVDIEELVRHAADISDLTSQKLYIYGYTRARLEETAFIDRIAADGSLYHLPVVEGSDTFAANADFAARMVSRGWVVLEDSTRGARTVGERAAAKFAGLADAPPPELGACTLQDAASEVRFVLGEVKKLLRSGVPASEIAILARDLDLYSKEINVVGAEYGVPTMTSLRVPLSETLVGNFVALLLEAVEHDFRFEETARLLGHPLGPGMSDATWLHSRRRHTEGYSDWLALESSLECLESYRDGEIKPVRIWVDCLRSMFSHFRVRSRAGHIAREVVAFNCLLDELDFLAEDGEETTFPGFTAEIREILGTASIPFDPSRAGVLVTEPNIIVGGRFRHVFALGLAEGILPAAPSDNPVIDFHERRTLSARGIDFEAAADIPRWEALSFFGLLCTVTESLTLTRPKMIGKEEKIESSFFKRLGVEPADTRISILSSDDERLRYSIRKPVEPADHIHAAARRQLDIERRREAADPHDEYDGAIGHAIDLNGHLWSVSQMKALAGCGFQWFAKYGLKVAPPDERELEVSYAALGKLFHFALEHAVIESGARTREQFIHALDEALEAGYRSEDVGMPTLTNWHLLRPEYLTILTRAVEAQDFLPEGTEIVATEQYFNVTLHGISVQGWIDRVDRRADGLFAVDYKTGSKKPAPVSDRDGRKMDLQIAVYLAAMQTLYPGENISGGAYYSLSSCKSFRAAAADETVVKEFVDGLIEAPLTGSLPVRPISDGTCEYCDFDLLCRNGSRIVRKEAAAK